MNFKLDENFGTRTVSSFRAAGHDVETVFQESLSGASDQRLYEICVQEMRCLVTLDLDFTDVVRFPPTHTAGIVVIRTPRNPSLTLLTSLVQSFLDALDQLSITGSLWVVEPGRIRIRDTDAS